MTAIKALVAAAMVLAATPALAQTTTAFDGTYVGVSLAVEGGVSVGSATNRCGLMLEMGGKPPATLRIENGVARSNGKPLLEGSVNAQGWLAMRRPSDGGKFEGQIDRSGRVTGRLTIACAYQLIWQKVPR